MVIKWSLLLYVILLFLYANVYGQLNQGYSYNPYYYQARQNNLGNTLRLRKYNVFNTLALSIGGYRMLYKNNEQFTLFVVENKILNDYINLNGDSFSTKRKLIESHVFAGKLNSTYLRQQLSLSSVSQHKFIVNSIYDREKKKHHIWIQGVKIKLPPIATTNGLIYEIESIFEEPKQSILEYLKSSGSHNIIYKMMKKQNIYFQFPYGVTFLAPFDKAFKKLPSTYLEDLMVNDIKQRSFIRNHIMTKPMCRDRLFHTIGWSRVINNLGRSLRLYQDGFNARASYINGAAVLTSTSIKQGWVYGVTETLLPEITLNILETLRHLHCHTFLLHLITTGYMHKLESVLVKHTLFAPSDKAFEKLPDKIKERLTNDKEFLRYVMQYHITKQRELTDNFNVDKSVVTYAINETNGIRSYLVLNLQQHGNISVVQDTEIIKPDNLATNGIVHIINDVMIPPTRTIMDILQTVRSFRIFRKLLTGYNASFTESLRNNNGRFTVFVPINRAFKIFYNNIGSGVRLKNNSVGNMISNTNQDKRAGLINKHVFPDLFLPTNVISSVNKEFTYQIKKLNGQSAKLVAKGNTLKLLKYNPVSIIHTAIAKNGIIIVINQVINKRKIYNNLPKVISQDPVKQEKSKRRRNRKKRKQKEKHYLK